MEYPFIRYIMLYDAILLQYCCIYRGISSLISLRRSKIKKIPYRLKEIYRNVIFSTFNVTFLYFKI